MKQLLILFLFAPVIASAQKDSLWGIMPMENGKVYYSQVVEAPGFSKDSLYTKVKAYATRIYKPASVLMDDRQTGQLRYEALLGIDVGTLHKEYFTIPMDVYLKDGKVKLVVTDVTMGEGVFPIERMLRKLDVDTAALKKKEREHIRNTYKGGFQVMRSLDASINALINNFRSAILAKSEFDF